jgi:hypothetical protein
MPSSADRTALSGLTQSAVKPVAVLPFPQVVGRPALVLAAWTGTAALMTGLFAGSGIFLRSIANRPAWLVSLLVVLDPYLLQTVAFIHCLIALELWRRSKRQSEASRFGAMLPTVALCALLLAYYLLNDLVFKAAFDRPRPAAELRLSVGMITRYFASSNAGAPSGFASRAVFFLLTTALATLGTTTNPTSRSIFSAYRPACTFQFVLLVLVCVVRVVTGYHFWFDVLLGVSLGVYVYWILVFFIGAIPRTLSQGSADAGVVAVIMSLAIGLLLIGFSYCRDATGWLVTALGTLVLTAFTLRDALTTRTAHPE